MMLTYHNAHEKKFQLLSLFVDVPGLNNYDYTIIKCINNNACTTNAKP